MSKYKLIALDMDGTLLSTDKKITAATAAAIKKAVAAGKYVVISSGRSLDELKDYKEELKDFSHFVVSSGAMVYDNQKKEVLHMDTFTPACAKEIFDIAATEDIMLYCSKNGHCYIPQDKFDHLEEYGMGQYRQLYLNVSTFVPSIPGYFESGTAADATMDDLQKIIYFCVSKNRRERLNSRLDHDAYAVAYTEEVNIEITPKGSTKATGLLHLCDRLGISMNEVIAVGDSGNDTEMLLYAGFAVAMGNSTEDIKEICEVVVADNDHDGVAEAIERYLL